MMMLDSNILIYAALGESPEIITFVKDNEPAVSDISRVEVLGFHKITQPEIQFLEAFFLSSRVLPIDETIILRAIDLRQKRKIALGDALIAATALTHGLTLVTRNTKDFKWIDSLTLIDPLKK